MGTHEDATSVNRAPTELDDPSRQPADQGSDGPPDRSLVEELAVAHETLDEVRQAFRAQQEQLAEILQKQARQREAHRRFISRLLAPVVVTNGAGLIQAGNAPAATLFDVRLDELPGRTVFSFVEVSEQQSVRERLSRAVATGETEFHARTHFLLPEFAEPVLLDAAATVHLSHDPARDVEVTWVLLRDTAAAGPGGAASAGGAQLARALVDLAQVPLESTDRADVARRVVRLCQQAFPAPVTVSLSLGDPMAPDLVAADSSDAQAVDGAQLETGEGPGIDAWGAGTPVASEDLAADDRWPRLRRRLSDSGPTSAVSLPLLMDDLRAGTMSVYSSEPIAARGAVVEAAELVASTVATVLQEVSARAELETVAEQLNTALESRATIDQAKGILMARHGCDADEAFRMLAKVSSTSNVKLREVARRLVDEASSGEPS